MEHTILVYILIEKNKNKQPTYRAGVMKSPPKQFSRALCFIDVLHYLVEPKRIVQC